MENNKRKREKGKEREKKIKKTFKNIILTVNNLWCAKYDLQFYFNLNCLPIMIVCKSNNGPSIIYFLF